MNINLGMDPLLAIGILIIAGFFGGLVARRIKFPTISGYIIVGMLLSPSVLNIIPSELIRGGLEVVTDIALGTIAYLVGGSLSVERLRRLKKSIAWITFFQAFGAWVFVTLLIIFLGRFIVRFDAAHLSFRQTYLPMALIIGAISLATAPAATMAIIREYKARGPLTTTLLGVVALDDAAAIIWTAITISIAGALVIGSGGISLYQMFAIPTFDIIGSILIGTILGFGLIGMSRFARTRHALLVVVFGTIMLAIGVTKMLNISSLLANMTLGFIVVNKMRYHKEMIEVIDDIEDVIFAIFFTVAGAHLDIEILKVAWMLALVVVIGRFGGKLLGSRIGASISGAPASVKKYLGLGLLPKAGVTVGLVILVSHNPAFQIFGTIMVNAVLASVIINELIAPPLAKYAIFKAGEAAPS